MVFNSRVVPVFMLQMTNISGPSISGIPRSIKIMNFIYVELKKTQQPKLLSVGNICMQTVDVLKKVRKNIYTFFWY